MKDSGFIDIEEVGLWQWHSRYFQLRYDPMTFEHKTEYFTRATHFAHSHEFTSIRDKLIWIMHSEGTNPYEISEKLEDLGFDLKKDWIYRTIERLEKVMLGK